MLITAKQPSKRKIYIDIKNKRKKYGKRDTDRWIAIATAIKNEGPQSIFMTYSETGYTKGTKERLKENGILIVCKKGAGNLK